MQYTNIIYGYMAFAGFSIFFLLLGIIMLQLLVKFQIPLDAFSFTFILYNFSVSSSSMHTSDACVVALERAWPSCIHCDNVCKNFGILACQPKT